jgi:hypothetical protein
MKVAFEVFRLLILRPTLFLLQPSQQDEGLLGKMSSEGDP